MVFVVGVDFKTVDFKTLSFGGFSAFDESAVFLRVFDFVLFPFFSYEETLVFEEYRAVERTYYHAAYPYVVYLFVFNAYEVREEGKLVYGNSYQASQMIL